MPTEIALLSELVAIPSVSGAEAEVARHLEDAARRAGLDVARDDASVTAVADRNSTRLNSSH